MFARHIQLIQERQTYTRVAYLLLSFPLGIFYFVFLVTCIATGLATSIVWIGIPILLLTMFAWRGLAAFERSYTMKWFQMDIPPISLPLQQKHEKFWARMRASVNNRMTWKTLAYLFVKFPFGILSFVIALSIVILIVCLSLACLLIVPFVYPLALMRSQQDVSRIGRIIWLVLLVIIGSFVGAALFQAIFIVPALALPSNLADGTFVSTIGPIFTVLVATLSLVFFSISPQLLQSISSRSVTKPTVSFKRILWDSLTCYGLILSPLSIISGMTWLWLQFARAMLGMSDKDIRLAQAEARAIQERAKAERAEQSRRELIVNVSHELRTPVASIRGHIESLLLASEEEHEPQLSQEALRNYLTIVHREATRLGALVEDLLSLARTEVSELKLEITAVDAGEVVEEVYQTLMPLARRERQITLVRDIGKGLPNVLADRKRLIQVLLNLVRNAITYTPDGGIVAISLAFSGSKHLALTVADTGIGIPQEDLENIFERFYRTDASRSRSSGGFGLGLAIVRDLVTAMGGAVSVESKEGEGSSFQVLLLLG